MVPQPIIHINSFPGVGKLTVARELVTILGGEPSARLIDNHLLIDAAAATLPRTSPGYVHLRAAIRSAVLGSIVSSEDSFDSTYIFTDFQSDNNLGRAVCEEYRTAAKARGSVFVPITLDCSLDENLRRATLPARGTVGRTKLLDATLIAQMRSRSHLYNFDVPEQLIIDTTNRSAVDTALMIAQHVDRLCLS